MDTADVVIVGAGFAGGATAYHLTRRGIRNVLVLEREAVAGMHASGRNAALAFQVLSDAAEARLAVEGVRFIASPPDEFTAVPLLRRCGSLLVAQVDGVPQLQRAQRDALQLGLECEILSPEEAAERVPVLAGAPFAAAFWNWHDGIVDIHELLQSFLAGARRGGARVEFRRAVTAVRTAHGRISAVETERGAVETRCLVNAAGAWAGEVNRLAGAVRSVVGPRRRHLFLTLADSPIRRDWPFVWHNDLDVYFRPEGEGLLMSPCDTTPHPPREPVVDDAVQHLLAQKVARAFPALASVRIASSWCCLRTFVRDERFVIGRDPQIEGLVWVGALGGHGMTTSPAVGRLGAAAVLRESSAELEYFSPARLM